ncbi:MAG: thioredoxin family protein [Planctomycetota bacterium]
MDKTKRTRSCHGSASFGWVVAVLLVAVAWAGAYALRGGGSKDIMLGWVDGMPAGQQLAEESDKPMVVLFTAGWCPPCQSLKKNVLTKDEVTNALQAGFIPVQIDLTDRSASNPNLHVAQQYGVQGIPTVIAMTPDGEPIGTYAGGDRVETFTGWLDRMAK